MDSITVGLARGVVLALALSALSTITRADDKPSKQEAIAKARQDVIDAEKQLNTVLVTLTPSGVPAVGIKELILAQLTLLEAKARLALLEEKSQELLENLTTLTEVRQKIWAASKGAGDKSEADEARVELASARVRLELHSIVMVRERQLAEAQELVKQRKATQSVADAAQKALDAARARLRNQP